MSMSKGGQAPKYMYLKVRMVVAGSAGMPIIAQMQMPLRNLAANASISGTTSVLSVKGATAPSRGDQIRERRNENEKHQLKSTVQSLRVELERQQCIGKGKRSIPTKQEVLDCALARLQHLWEVNAHLKRILTSSPAASARSCDASDASVSDVGADIDDKEEPLAAGSSSLSSSLAPSGLAGPDQAAGVGPVEPLPVGAEGEPGLEGATTKGDSLSFGEGGFDAFMTCSFMGGDLLPGAMDMDY